VRRADRLKHRSAEPAEADSQYRLPPMPPPFDAPYIERALLAGVLLAVPFGLLGTWVVLRGLAFFAHGVGVATFPGVVVGLGLPALGPIAGSLAAAAGFTAAVSLFERDHRLRGGAVTGLVLAIALALGGLLLTSVFRVAAPVESALFGSLLAISGADVVRCAAVALVALVTLVLTGRSLAASTFDREWAGPAGLRPGRGDVLLLGLLALAVVTALPAVGSLLVSGLLVVPAATARLVTDRLAPMQALAVALCALETVLGLALARTLDIPPGSAVAALAGLGFGLVAAVADLIRRARHASRIEAGA